MTGTRFITDSELQAFIDGALEGAQLREIATLVAADPALAAKVAGFRADNNMLKQVYGPIRERPIPAHWLALAHSAKSAKPLNAKSRVPWRGIAAIAAAIIVMLAGTLAYRQGLPSPAAEIVAAALDAREQAGGGGEKVLAIRPSLQYDSGRYDAVLSSAVAFPVKVPDLRKMGYRLAGLRLYSRSGNGGAAELLYRDNAGRLFTLYVRRSDGSARFDQFEKDGLRVCVWQDDEVGMVMAGNVSTAAMQRLASLAYTGLIL
jgi:anti-sigma factor RsiW